MQESVWLCASVRAASLLCSAGSWHQCVHLAWPGGECCCWLFLYSAILRSPADSLCLHVILHKWLAFYSAFFWVATKVVYLQRWHNWCHMKLLPSQCVLRTPYNHTPCHFMQNHNCKVHVCLAVTCHLHFWQNDWGHLPATVVTRGWNGYQNKSQHRKLTTEKKILPLLLQGFEPATFQSWVRHMQLSILQLQGNGTLFLDIKNMFIVPLHINGKKWRKTW